MTHARMTLQKLKHIQRNLYAGEFGTQAEFLLSLGRGEEPIAVMLTCSDLGGTPDQVSQAHPGDIMVVQNPGGIVTGVGDGQIGTTSGSIYYVMQYPNVRHLIVCGHLSCSIIHLLLFEERSELDMFRGSVDSVAKLLDQHYSDVPEERLLEVAVQENVLQQLVHLRESREIRSKIEDRQVRLHGWVYDDHTSLIFSFDPLKGKFTRAVQ